MAADAGPGAAIARDAAAARHDAAAVGLLAGLAAFHASYSRLLALAPQEAYYWEWSRRLAASYFDHPPLAAWTIRAATTLLGDSEGAIRTAAAFHALVFGAFFWRAACSARAPAPPPSRRGSRCRSSRSARSS